MAPKGDEEGIPAVVIDMSGLRVRPCPKLHLEDMMLLGALSPRMTLTPGLREWISLHKALLRPLTTVNGLG